MKLNMRFPGGRPKALTFSYDDGVYQDLRLLQLFDRYNLKCTFNLNSGLLERNPGDRKSGHMTEEDTVGAYIGTSHEIAVHSFTHPHLEQIPIEQATKEIICDRMYLEKIFRCIVRGGAYPFGTTNDAVVATLRNSGICYCRTTHSTERFDIPQDWLRMSATCHHSNPRLMEFARRFVQESPDRQARGHRAPWMFYVWGHSYEFDYNEPHNNWKMMEEFCGTVSAKADVWYATNIEIYDYVQAFRQMQISLDESILRNPTALELYFECNQTIEKIEQGETKKLDIYL